MTDIITKTTGYPYDKPSSGMYYKFIRARMTTTVIYFIGLAVLQFGVRIED